MRLYKNFYVHKNMLLVREVKNGKDNRYKVPIKPSYYFVTDKTSEHKSVYKDNLIKMDFDSQYEARDWFKQYDTMKNKIFGFPNFEYNIIHKEYPGDVTSLFNMDIMTVAIFDIETEAEGRLYQKNYTIRVKKSFEQSMTISQFEKMNDGSYLVYDIVANDWITYKESCFYPKGAWPNHETANEEINLISISLKGNGHNGSIKCFGTKPAFVVGADEEYIQCEDEKDLLIQFTNHWMENYPDCISGWNSTGFDIPYLIKRLEIVVGEDFSRNLSPWKLLNEKKSKTDFGKEITKYEIVGINQFDYLELYKKFTYSVSESYKLDYIASVELNDKKVEYDCTFRELYTNYYQAFVDYNIHDVRLVRKLEDKMGLLALAHAIMYKAKVTAVDVFTTVRVWDVIISNALSTRNIHVPTFLKGHGDSSKYGGGYVKDPIIGFYKWLVSIDATSLYPSIERTLDISPETMLDPSEFIALTADDVVYRTERFKQASAKAKSLNACLAANGAMFDKTSQGIIPELNEFYFNQRVIEKKLGKDYEKAAANIAKILKARGVEV